MESLQREFSFFDKAQNNGIIRALYNQKHLSSFCDVIMKVCGREIFAHSNVLAAASPYFSSFLSQELPRHFSQRTPQVIEIQIDGNEPNILYEEAVSSVIDFIYTGEMVIKDSNVSQICEIARIMQMDNILGFCSDFEEGKDPKLGLSTEKLTADVCVGTESMDTELSEAGVQPPHQLPNLKHSRHYDSVFQTKVKAQKLISTSVQVYPSMLPELAEQTSIDKMRDQATSTDSRYFESLLAWKPGSNKKTSHSRKKPPKKTLRYILYSPELTSQEDNENAPETTAVNEAINVETTMEDPSKWSESAQSHENVEFRYEEIESDTEQHTEERQTNIQQGAQESTSTDVLENGVDPVTGNITETNTEPEASTSAGNLQRNEDIEIMVTKVTPRRSSRVSKPTAKLQGLQEMHKSHIGLGLEREPPVKRLKLEAPSEHQSASSGEYMVQVVVVQPEDESEGAEGTVKAEQTDQVEAAERLLSLAEEIVHQDSEQDGDKDYTVEELADGSQGSDDDDDEFTEHDAIEEVVEATGFSSRRRSTRRRGKCQTRRVTTLATSNFRIGPAKYQCESCSFTTNKVREMSAHIKLHKLENNTCYYCEQIFENKDVLTQHMDKHKGPNPFYCHVCQMRFKSRTLLNMHLPKHSDSKPYICDICCAGFKWKHALKCHMITHSNKKEHLCDTCGYATAHKSQLKAHRKIHTGDTYKCDRAGCDFEATKMQNMKYHLLTHTKEKPHQCEMCGQNFSLVKNLRRHLLLHNNNKDATCGKCAFTTTRMDKLKDHMLKIHGVGTPPERRLRVTDQVNQSRVRMLPNSILARVDEVDEDGDSEATFVKMETHQDEHVITTADSMTVESFAQGLAQADKTALIEIVQDSRGQPIQIFPEQSILIAQGHDGTLQDGNFTEMVQLGQNLVLTDQNSSIELSAAGLSEARTLTQAEVVALMQQNATLVAPVDAGSGMTTVDIHDLTGGDVNTVVEYSDLVEVNVPTVTAFVEGDTYQDVQ